MVEQNEFSMRVVNYMQPEDSSGGMAEPVEVGDLNESTGPGSIASKLQNVLVANDAYISSLESCLNVIDEHIAQKEEKEAAMRAALPCTSAVPITTTLYHTPYFQTIDGTPAPPSTLEIESTFVLNAEDPNVAQQLWKESADTQLLELVTRRKKELRTLDLQIQKKRAELDIVKLRRSLKDSPEVVEPSMEGQLQEKSEFLEKVRVDLEFLEQSSYETAGLGLVQLQKYDWFDIAQNPKLKRYGVEACRLRFMNKLDPALSHRPWSDYEIDRLRELLLEHGLHDWETVSQELPGRSAMDCCGQYRKTMSSVGIAMKGHVEETTDFTRFSPEEVVKLVHGWLVCGGVMPLVCQFLPHRTASQCYKYLKNNLNFNAERTPFTDAELKFIQQFGRQTKTAGLVRLYQRFPTRPLETVKAKFLEMFKRVDESWVEIKQSAHNRSADTGREQENVILHKLYDHVASSVTKPLREDLNLRLDDLVTQEEIVGPVKILMADLQILPLSVTTPDLLTAVRLTLSPLDRGLLELFSAPRIKKPIKTGRPRKTNPFGPISLLQQPSTLEEKQAIIRSAIPTDLNSNAETPDAVSVLLPPSYCTMDALLKLKELCHDVEEVTEDVYAACDFSDLQTMERRVQSLLLTSEILVQQERAGRDITEQKVEGLPAVDEEGSSFLYKGELKQQKKYPRKLKGATLMGRRFKWWKEMRERKAAERVALLEKRALTAAERLDSKAKRVKKTLVPVRQSGRLTKNAQLPRDADGLSVSESLSETVSH